MSNFLDERGEVAAEYAILAALFGAMVVVTVTILGGVVSGLFETAGPF